MISKYRLDLQRCATRPAEIAILVLPFLSTTRTIFPYLYMKHFPFTNHDIILLKRDIKSIKKPDDTEHVISIGSEITGEVGWYLEDFIRDHHGDRSRVCSSRPRNDTADRKIRRIG